MKSKDMTYMLLAVVILLGAGYLAYTQLIPNKSTASSTVTVEKVDVIDGTLDSVGMAALNDPVKTVDFNSPVDLDHLGNAAPFGQ